MGVRINYRDEEYGRAHAILPLLGIQILDTEYAGDLTIDRSMLTNMRNHFALITGVSPDQHHELMLTLRLYLDTAHGMRTYVTQSLGFDKAFDKMAHITAAKLRELLAGRRSHCIDYSDLYCALSLLDAVQSWLEMPLPGTQNIPETITWN